MDVGSRFGPDLHAGILCFKYAVLYHDVAAGAILVSAARGLDHHGVVAADDLAVANLHILASIGIDAIAIGHIELIEDLNAVDQGVLATDEMDCPTRRLLERDAGDLEVVASRELKQPRPESGGAPPFI